MRALDTHVQQVAHPVSRIYYLERVKALTSLLDDLRSPAHAARPLVIAHRGASGFAPENTLTAFRLAIVSGADGVEMDVQLSADGTPVVMHDTRVNRTTDGTGAVSHLTLDQIQALDAGSWFERRLTRRPRLSAMVKKMSAESRAGPPNLSGQRVPTLKDALAVLTPAGLEQIYVELKGDSGSRERLLEAVLSVTREIRGDCSVTVLSFDHEIVRRAKEIDPGIRTAATFPATGRRLISTGSIIRAAKGAGVDEVALHLSLATKRSVEALHENGLRVSVWTANGKLAMRRLVACGVDAIMTNFPNRLREVLDSQAPQRVVTFGRGGQG